MNRPPFQIGDRVRSTYRKKPENRPIGTVTKIHEGGLGWVVYVRGVTSGGNSTVRCYLDPASLELISTSAPPKEGT